MYCMAFCKGRQAAFAFHNGADLLHESDFKFTGMIRSEVCLMINLFEIKAFPDSHGHLGFGSSNVRERYESCASQIGPTVYS